MDCAPRAACLFGEAYSFTTVDCALPVDCVDVGAWSIEVVIFEAIASLLAERVGTAADTIAIASASSKTAIGLAHLLSTRRSLDIVEDTKMVRFFAPDQIRKRVREWGAGEFDRRYNEALQAYIRHSRGWLHIVEGFGPKKVVEVFERVSRNQVRPDEGHLLSLHGRETEAADRNE